MLGALSESWSTRHEIARVLQALRVRKDVRTSADRGDCIDMLHDHSELASLMRRCSCVDSAVHLELNQVEQEPTRS